MGDAAEDAEVLVDAQEDVCRLCFASSIPISRDAKHPNQVDADTGLIRLEEIGWDDMKLRGFSLQRRMLYSLQEALQEAARRDSSKSAAKGKQVSYRLAGVLITRAECINAIADSEGSQVFKVIATPTEAQPGHAEIRIADHLQKHHLLKFRVHLQTALGPMQDAALIET